MSLTTRALESTLARFREEAKALRANGHVAQADTIERMAASVEVAAADYLEWISEPDAMRRSGRSVQYFRARRRARAAEGVAEVRGREWWYRRIAIESQESPHLQSDAEQGRDAARRTRKERDE